MSSSITIKKFNWISFCQILQRQDDLADDSKKKGKKNKKNEDKCATPTGLKLTRVFARKIHTLFLLKNCPESVLPFVKVLFVDVFNEFLTLIDKLVDKSLQLIQVYITTCIEGLQQLSNLLEDLSFCDYHIYGSLYHFLRHLPILLNHLAHTISTIAYSNISASSTTIPGSCVPNDLCIVEDLTIQLKIIEKFTSNCLAQWQRKEKQYYLSSLMIIQQPMRKPNLFQFQQSIHQHYEWHLSQVPAIHRQNQIIQNDLLKMLNQHWKSNYQFGCELFGSRISGLASLNSDLDLSLSVFQKYHDGTFDLVPIIVDNRPDIRRSKPKPSQNGGEHVPPPTPIVEPGVTTSYLLQSIKKLTFRHNSPFVCKEMISWARVPIIKLIHKSTGVEVDICIENQLGVQNTYILRDAIQQDIRIHQLLLVIKYWISQRCLNQSSHGTLSTFSWCMMVLYFVMHIVQPPMLTPIQITPEGQEIIHHCQKDKAKHYAAHCDTHVKMFSLSGTTKAQQSVLGSFPNTKPVHELVLEFFQFFASDYLLHSYDYYHEMVSLLCASRGLYYFYDSSKRHFLPYSSAARSKTVNSVLFPATTTPIVSNTNATNNDMNGSAIKQEETLNALKQPSLLMTPKSTTTIATASLLVGSPDDFLLPSSPSSGVSVTSSTNEQGGNMWLLSGLLEGDDDDSDNNADDDGNNHKKKKGKDIEQAQQDALLDALIEEDRKAAKILLNENEDILDEGGNSDEEDSTDEDEDAEEEQDVDGEEGTPLSELQDAMNELSVFTTITTVQLTPQTASTTALEEATKAAADSNLAKAKVMKAMKSATKKEESKQKRLVRKFFANLQKQSIIKIQDSFEGFNLGRVVHNFDIQQILQSELRRYYCLLMTDMNENLWEKVNEKQVFSVSANKTAKPQYGGRHQKPFTEPSQSNVQTKAVPSPAVNSEPDFMYCDQCKTVGHTSDFCVISFCQKCHHLGHKEHVCPVQPCIHCKRFDHESSVCPRAPKVPIYVAPFASPGVVPVVVYQQVNNHTPTMIVAVPPPLPATATTPGLLSNNVPPCPPLIYRPRHHQRHNNQNTATNNDNNRHPKANHNERPPRHVKDQQMQSKSQANEANKSSPVVTQSTVSAPPASNDQTSRINKNNNRPPKKKAEDVSSSKMPTLILKKALNVPQ